MAKKFTKAKKSSCLPVSDIILNMKQFLVIKIYAAAVCFFSAAAGIISLISVADGVLSYAAPTFFMSGDIYNGHLNNRAYVRWHARESNRWGEAEPQPLPSDEKELTILREESLSAAIAAEKHNAAASIVRSIIAALLCAALFFPHWRQMKKIPKE